MVDLFAVDNAVMESLLPPPLLHVLRLPIPPAAAIADACAHLEAVLAALRPFVPRPALAVHLAVPAHSRIIGQYRTGTIVFADVSGFTALSSELATTGRHGSEEISGVINQLFAALLDPVVACGGWVVKFGGDAVTAFFDASDLGDDHARHACAAALAMQGRMADFAAMPTSKGTFPLHLRVTVHTGRVFLAEVGDSSHTEIVMTGSTINQVMAAQERAAPGEVVLSNTVRGMLAGAHTQPKQSGLYVLTALPGDPISPPARPPAWRPRAPSIATLQLLLRHIVALRPYLPHELPNRFVQGTHGGEFRPVTVLFANFYAFSHLLALLDLDATLLGHVLNACYIRTQEVIHRFGGSINKVDMVAKGDRLMALFGAPTAHEDDPVRAVQAALELRTVLDDVHQEATALVQSQRRMPGEQQVLLGLARHTQRQRVGMAHGTVFAGIVGTPERHEYTVMGSTVNLAARLLSEADDGDVLLPSLTNLAVQHLIKTQPLAPLRLKGFILPIPVFRVAQQVSSGTTSPSARREAPLVGRDAQMAQLLAIARHALAPGPDAIRIVSLVGEAGIGKSRLATEALRALQATTPAAMLVQETCQGYEETTPYAVIARLVRQLLRLPHVDHNLQRAALLDQLEDLAPDGIRFAPLLGSLLAVPLPPTDVTEALTPEQRRDRLHDLIILMCGALARRQPLVLVINNLQWVDASSRLLLTRLAAELNDVPLLLLLLARATPGLVEWWRDLPQSTVIALEELTRVDSEALLAALLGGAPPEALQPLIERAHGTPFYLEETVRYLLVSGTLQQASDGSWVCTQPINGTTVPLEIEQMLIARLDRLGNTAQILLQAAAVIGQQFSADLLVAVASAESTLAHSLEELVHAELLLVNKDTLPQTYRFKHALVQDVTYSSILFARRRQLHLEIAGAIEHIYAADLDSRLVVVAQHYRAAEQPERAFPYFLRAAEQVQARYANLEALALYEQAVATAPRHSGANGSLDLPLAITLYGNMGDVLTLIGDYDAARRTYEQLLGLLQNSDAHTYHVQQAKLQRKIGSTHEHQGHHDAALQSLERAAATMAAVLDSNDDRSERTHILSGIGWVHFRRSDLVQAQQYLEQALAYCGDDTDYNERAAILNRLGGIAWSRGDLLMAQHYVEQSLAASRNSSDLVTQAKALNNLSILAEGQGQADDALRYSVQAIEINERVGNKREWGISANNAGWALYNNGKYVEAETYLRRAIACAEAVHDSYNHMRALLNLGRVLTLTARLNEAEQALAQSREIGRQLNLPAEQLETYVALAEVALRQGDVEKAQGLYQQGLPFATDAESEEYGRFQRLEAQLAWAQGDIAHAAQLFAANEALFVQLQNAPEVARTKRLLAEMPPP
ncbi:MAG: tetratricopeptide repeat protein [Chloroflexales bacterium]|nr:tetratricopeptide repeat protein [Chloroflexales bacterium]